MPFSRSHSRTSSTAFLPPTPIASRTLTRTSSTSRRPSRDPILCASPAIPASQNPAPLAAPSAPSAAAFPPTPAIRIASTAVDALYGDDEDENQAFFRLCQARNYVAASKLPQQMHSSELIYGEFDLATFGAALQAACGAVANTRAPYTFIDVGSGYGRLVHTAAASLGEDWRCHGLEIVPGMHEYASELLAEAREDGSYDWVDRVEFGCGDYSVAGGEAEKVLGRADVIFIFATTWPTAGTSVLNTVSAVLGERLKEGAIVITIDKHLATEALGEDGRHFERLYQFEGENKCTGDSIVYVQRFYRRPNAVCAGK